MPLLSPASARRLARSIRWELEGSGALIRLVIQASDCMWKLVDGKVTTGREVVLLTALPSDDALVSLMRTFCREHPMVFEKDFTPLTDEERAFLVQTARDALPLWVSDANPLRVIFHCAPSLYCVSMQYPPALVEYVLEKLDGLY